MAPRWLLPGSISRASLVPNASLFFKEDIAPPLVQNKSITLIAIDSELERSIGIGTAWPYRSLGKGEVSLTASVLQSLRVRPNQGDRVVLSFTLDQALKALGSNFNTTTIINQTLNGTLNGGNTTISNATFNNLTPDERQVLKDNLKQDSSGNFILNTTGISATANK